MAREAERKQRDPMMSFTQKGRWRILLKLKGRRVIFDLLTDYQWNKTI
jgi:hypothetical protein